MGVVIGKLYISSVFGFVEYCWNCWCGYGFCCRYDVLKFVCLGCICV